MTTLKECRFLQDNLIGSLPTELGRLSALVSLSINQNSLTSSIPTEIGMLSSLTWLNLQQDGLTGTLPTEIGRMTSITSFAAHQNKLRGAVPASIALLGRLVHLDLNINSLSQLPEELEGLSSLETLELMKNSLSGNLPTGLGRLTSLVGMSVQGNRLHGHIPTELGSLTLLEALFLAYNAFTGPVPSELANLAVTQPNATCPYLGLLETSQSGCTCKLQRKPSADWREENDLTISMAPELDTVRAICLLEDFPHPRQSDALQFGEGPNGWPTDAHMSCGMCMRHRCTLYGMNKCAARLGFADPGNADRRQCMHACCAEQCKVAPSDRAATIVADAALATTAVAAEPRTLRPRAAVFALCAVVVATALLVPLLVRESLS